VLGVEADGVRSALVVGELDTVVLPEQTLQIAYVPVGASLSVRNPQHGHANLGGLASCVDSEPVPLTDRG
jgi:hypothetical protein